MVEVTPELSEEYDRIAAEIYSESQNGFRNIGAADLVDIDGHSFIGKGVSRFVFETSDYVVKFARCDDNDVVPEVTACSGLVQNSNEVNRTKEFDVDESIFAEIIDFHPQYLWVAQEKVNVDADVTPAERTDLEITLCMATELTDFDFSVEENLGKIDGSPTIVDFGWWKQWDSGKDYKGLVEAAKCAVESILG